MINDWLEDDYPVRPKRSRGRPLKNPFSSPEVEEDFVARGSKIVELYFDDSDSKSNKDFAFTERWKMSKTSFWSMVFLYYLKGLKKITENVQGYHAAIRKHFDACVVSDRSSLEKCTEKYDKLFIYHSTPPSESLSPTMKTRLENYRKQYQRIIRLWEGITVN